MAVILWELFIAFVKVGLFSFGGGYAALPLIQNQVVHECHWLSLGEFSDLIAISQLTPGPIAINSASFVGFRLAGTPGAVIATLGCIFPPVVLVSLLGWLYRRYGNLPWLRNILAALRPAVTAMIFSSGLGILLHRLSGTENIFRFSFSRLDSLALLLFFVFFFLLRRYKWSPFLLMAAAGTLGGLVYALVP